LQPADPGARTALVEAPEAAPLGLISQATTADLSSGRASPYWRTGS